jgi:phosphatidyl-myo-inositol dimannoside synthase
MPTKPEKVLNLVVDQRLHQTPDGRVWSLTPPAYDFFELPLEVFDQVRVVARTAQVAEPRPKARLVNGPGVEVLPIPTFVGPFQYLKQRNRIAEKLAQIARLDGAFLLRIPSQTGFVVASKLRARNRPFAVELLTDPYDFFAAGVSPHGLATLFRPYFCHQSKELCGEARVVNYVTGKKTIRNNPPLRANWTGNVSDVDLPEQAFFLPNQAATPGPIRIVSVGLLDLLYKGQDLLIQALGKAHQKGLDFTLRFVGDGGQRARLLSMADSCGIQGRVEITGAQGGAAEVRGFLKDSDLFVLPSRAEGIPRALLEAMAAGLPAICSQAGAMPDLIEQQWITGIGDEDALCQALLAFANHRSEWQAIGQRNQQVARGFELSLLRPKRREFYEAIQRMASSTAEEGLYAA